MTPGPRTFASGLGVQAAILASIVCSAVPAAAQSPIAVPPGRAAIESLTFEQLEFEQPEVERLNLDGVDVLHLEDRSLPLVTVLAYFRGGYGLFPRDRYAAAMGLPALLRYGGTSSRTAAAVDEEIAFYAHQLSFGSAGGSVTSSLNTLSEHLVSGLGLWADMLTRPAFDQSEIDSWRTRQLEGIARRLDDPARLAYSELNRLLFGDHPVGWEMEASDLDIDRIDPEDFRSLHARVICRDNLVLGVTGDVGPDELVSLLGPFLSDLPACTESLPAAPVPEIRRAPGVFLVEKELDQAVIAMAHPSDIRLRDDPEYFSALIGNAILGGGGFSSRLLSRVRTEEGYAYSAASLLTTPRRHEGLIGATTRTRPDHVIPAIEVVLETMEGLTRKAPTTDELETTVSQIVNGFVFNFDTPSAIVSRSMYYVAQDLPSDWLERYWSGVQEVTPESIRSVFAQHLRPNDMTILVVGDPERIGLEALERLGPVTSIEVR